MTDSTIPNTPADQLAMLMVLCTEKLDVLLRDFEAASTEEEAIALMGAILDALDASRKIMRSGLSPKNSSVHMRGFLDDALKQLAAYQLIVRVLPAAKRLQLVRNALLTTP
jgi:hypothetical protein